jgi:hypothetical protein
VCIWQRKRVFERTHELLYGAKVRRQVKRAARDSGFGELSVEKIVMTLPGEWVNVSVPRGATVEKLERPAPGDAQRAGVRDVRVIPDRENRSGRASISIIRRDPFEHIDGYVWPTDARRADQRARADACGLRRVRPPGQDAAALAQPDRRRSARLGQVLLPAAARRLRGAGPQGALWLMDGKSVEFEAWKTCAHDFVSGPDLEGAVKMLTKLRDEMEARYERIRAAGEVFVTEDMEVDVLMIDEVPTYTAPDDHVRQEGGEQIKTIQGLLWTIVARGRAAGVITILSAQKPDANTIPTDIRDLFDNKLALHCNTKAMSDTILGQGAGEESVANAAEIPSGQPGVGYYVGDSGVAKIKCFYISHQQAIEVASRVASRQLDDELSTLNA